MTDSPRASTTGVVCLQGGNELTAPCRPMDSDLLTRAPDGRVVVLPLASSRGSDYSRTADNAARYFADLGADVAVPDDPRRDAAEALALLDEAGMIVLTGGSPRRLRDGLVETGLDAAIVAASRRGALVMGASAGAMVACTTTLLPQWRGNPQSGAGIGLVDGYVVVPHFDGKRSAWVREALANAPAALGIPECSGVIVDGGELTAVGVAPSTLITASGQTQLPLQLDDEGRVHRALSVAARTRAAGDTDEARRLFAESRRRLEQLDAAEALFAEHGVVPDPDDAAEITDLRRRLDVQRSG